MLKLQAPNLSKFFKNYLLKIKTSPIVVNIIEIYYRIRLAIIYFFIALAYLLLISKIFNNDSFDSIISYAEKTAIFIATITILTFTYSLALDYPKRKLVLKSGEHFLNSFLNFTIGVIFLLGFKDSLSNPSNILGLPPTLFNFMNIFPFLFSTIGALMLISSASLFASAISDLLKSLENNQ